MKGDIPYGEADEQTYGWDGGTAEKLVTGVLCLTLALLGHLFYFSPVGVMQRSQCKLTSRQMFEIIVKENNEGLNRDSRSVVPMSVRSV